MNIVLISANVTLRHTMSSTNQVIVRMRVITLIMAFVIKKSSAKRKCSCNVEILIRSNLKFMV